MLQNSLHQGRSQFDARSVLFVRKHSKLAKTPLADIFNIPILQCLSLVTQVHKKKRGTCFQIPRSRAQYVVRSVLPAISAATVPTATISSTATSIASSTEASRAWSLRFCLIDGQGSSS